VELDLETYTLLNFDRESMVSTKRGTPEALDAAPEEAAPEEAAPEELDALPEERGRFRGGGNRSRIWFTRTMLSESSGKDIAKYLNSADSRKPPANARRSGYCIRYRLRRYSVQKYCMRATQPWARVSAPR